MENTEKSGLDQLCTKENLVYENYYSQTYRANFKLGGIQGDWDITHISLPFSPLKERELMARFELGKDDMEPFYVDFGRCVKNYMGTIHLLAEKDVDSVVLGPYYIDKKEGRGSDIYLVTPVMRPISEWLWDNEGTTTLENIISLGTRLCQISKGINDAGAHFGVVDLDSVYIVRRHERDLVTMGGFLFASRNGEPPVKLPRATPAHIHPALLDGTEPSMATDIYSICSLLWTLLNGDHYTTTPNLSKPPIYAPEGIAETLRLGLAPENIESTQDRVLETVKTINKNLHKCVRQLRAVDGNESLDNISITMAEPSYDLSVAYQHNWKFSKPKFAQMAPTEPPETTEKILAPVKDESPVTEEEIQALVERIKDREKMVRYFAGEKFPEFEGIVVTNEEIEAEFAEQEKERKDKEEEPRSAVELDRAMVHSERVYNEAVKRGLIPDTRPKTWDELSEEEKDQAIIEAHEDVKAGKTLTMEKLDAEMDAQFKQWIHWDLLKQKAAERALEAGKDAAPAAIEAATSAKAAPKKTTAKTSKAKTAAKKSTAKSKTAGSGKGKATGGKKKK